eukprot:5647230-Pleurochrysis_carterae.AAC.1
MVFPLPLTALASLVNCECRCSRAGAGASGGRSGCGDAALSGTEPSTSQAAAQELTAREPEQGA